jgi:hypothetical protein
VRGLFGEKIGVLNSQSYSWPIGIMEQRIKTLILIITSAA